MSLEHFECTTPQADPTDDPTVSMDATYGSQLQPGAVLDFDYDAFRASAERVHGAPMPLGRLAVQLTSEYAAEGAYNGNGHSSNQLVVKARIAGDGTLKTPRRVQNTVQHELKHFSDKLNDRLERGRVGELTYTAAQRTLPPRNMITTAALSLLPNITANALPAIMYKTQASGQLAESIASFPWEHAVAYETMTHVPLAACALIGASALRYCLDPAEMRARRAGRMDRGAAHAIGVRSIASGQ